MQTPGRTTTGTAAVKPVSSQINLIGSFGIHINVEPDEEVVAVPEAHEFSVMSMTCCSKLGTTMRWKWFSRICEGQHQVELDPSVHNPPSRRLHHWRHHQQNFMIAHSHRRVVRFVSYAQPALGTQPCRRRHDFLRFTLCGCKPRSS